MDRRAFLKTLLAGVVAVNVDDVLSLSSHMNDLEFTNYFHSNPEYIIAIMNLYVNNPRHSIVITNIGEPDE